MKKILLMIVTFMMLFISLEIHPVLADDDLKLAESAKSAILIEASTGKILFEKKC